MSKSFKESLLFVSGVIFLYAVSFADLYLTVITGNDYMLPLVARILQGVLLSYLFIRWGDYVTKISDVDEVIKNTSLVVLGRMYQALLEEIEEVLKTSANFPSEQARAYCRFAVVVYGQARLAPRYSKVFTEDGVVQVVFSHPGFKKPFVYEIHND